MREFDVEITVGRKWLECSICGWIGPVEVEYRSISDDSPQHLSMTCNHCGYHGEAMECKPPSEGEETSEEQL